MADTESTLSVTISTLSLPTLRPVSTLHLLPIDVSLAFHNPDNFHSLQLFYTVRQIANLNHLRSLTHIDLSRLRISVYLGLFLCLSFWFLGCLSTSGFCWKKIFIP